MMRKKWRITLSIFIAISLTLYFWLGYKIDHGSKTNADGTSSYVIILGAKVKASGIPSLALKNRLEVAIPYLHKHSDLQVIVSGGRGQDEPQTEASVMKQYLIDGGIDESRIHIEDASTSTYENFLFSKKLLPEDVRKITIISNDFHLTRALFLASKVGLKADVIAAPTPKVVELKSRLRERFALLKTYIVGH